jgi:glyoxylase-like metal-dependent hydrolase (beta-lactamase superfamily II)
MSVAGKFGYSIYTGSPLAFAPNSVILHGPTEMVLVDAQFLLSDGRKLVEQMKATGRRLTTILITHAHPDHLWGLPEVLAAYPDARVFARPGVLAEINRDFLAKRIRWQTQFPGDIPAHLPMIDVLEGNILLDGEVIEFFDIPAAETECATGFYLPVLKLAIGGDLLFNRFHMYLADLNNPRAWLHALDVMEARVPDAVDIVPGHGEVTTKAIYDESRAYLSYYDEVAQPFVPRATILDAMVARFPEHRLPMIIALEIGPAITDPEMLRRLQAGEL